MRNFDKADFDKCLDRLCGVVDGSPSVASSGLQVEVFDENCYKKTAMVLIVFVAVLVVMGAESSV